MIFDQLVVQKSIFRGAFLLTINSVSIIISNYIKRGQDYGRYNIFYVYWNNYRCNRF